MAMRSRIEWCSQISVASVYRSIREGDSFCGEAFHAVAERSASLQQSSLYLVTPDAGMQMDKAQATGAFAENVAAPLITQVEYWRMNS